MLLIRRHEESEKPRLVEERGLRTFLAEMLWEYIGPYVLGCVLIIFCGTIYGVYLMIAYRYSISDLYQVYTGDMMRSIYRAVFLLIATVVMFALAIKSFLRAWDAGKDHGRGKSRTD